MIDFKTFGDILDELCEELPQEVFERLSGGVVVSRGVKRHKKSVGNTLFVLGEYVSGVAGRHIVIYYGSFVRVCGGLSDDEVKIKMRETLRHEFLHHAEGLAGEYALEAEDMRRLREYLQKNETKRDS